jgi:hypothetical protein
LRTGASLLRLSHSGQPLPLGPLSETRNSLVKAMHLNRGNCVLRFKRVELRDSARKHGVADEDIQHAVTYALLVAELDDDKILYLGPDRAGNLLEVVAVMRHAAPPLVIHAMAMRRRYEPYLRSQEERDG